MPRFMLVYRGGYECLQRASPSEMQHLIQSWIDWIECGARVGWMLGGDGLKPGGAVVHADLSVENGAFCGSSAIVDGYSLIETRDLAAAVELAKGSPQPGSGGSVEVRELGDVERRK